MCNLRYNSRGFTLIEVTIAMFLAAVAIMAILSMQPTAWQTSARSDFMGRASGILFEELQRQGALIMNPCNTVTTGTTGPTVVLPSDPAGTGGAQQPGDVSFTVTTTITALSATSWLVTVRVAWPGHTGISESLVVTRQEWFRTPGGC
jgi:prepilin-type N-terminal cleavage/methylation domain-containing protein